MTDKDVLAIIIIFILLYIIVRRLIPELVTPPPTQGVISGSAKTVEGVPVVDATVTVSDENGGTADTVLTDAQGNFTVKVLPLGKYRIDIIGIKNPDGSFYEGKVDVELAGTTLVVDVPMV